MGNRQRQFLSEEKGRCRSIQRMEDSNRRGRTTVLCYFVASQIPVYLVENEPG